MGHHHGASVRENRRKSGKVSGYQSEMDPNQKGCSKRLRRTRSTDLVSRKDIMYFEDGADWCSTCTSSSDDSDYERWDKDEEGPKTNAAIEERLSRSRPNPATKSCKSSKSRNLTRSSSSAITSSKSRRSAPKFPVNRAGTTGTSPTIIFYDDRPSFTRPDWLLDPISFNP